MESSCIFGRVCSIIVIYQIIRVILPWIYKNVVGPKLLGPRIDVCKMGSWALITGATDGIGKAYAIALAKKGLNIVLVSRSPDKLQNVATEIKELFNVKVTTIDVDFTHGFEIYEKIEKNILGLDIGVLVNNVGISYDHPEYFLQIENRDKFLQDIISCNIHSVTHMCKLILPGMVDRKKGVILNISSLSGAIPAPLLTIYSASKAFVDKFSEDLASEYKTQGIFVQSVLPGFVASNMTKIKKSTWITPSPKIYVESALKTLGIASQTTGYLPHALLRSAVYTLVALTCDSFASNFILNIMNSVRTKVLKKRKPN